jgi:hypothetical protein
LAVATLSGSKEHAGPKTWERGPTRPYAQVPEAGRDPDAISGGRDLSRPFRVSGSFTDDELVSLVAYLRTQPRATDDPGSRTKSAKPVFERVRGDWPIASVSRQDDAVHVIFLDEDPREKTGQLVELRSSGRDWTLVRLLLWVAD